MKLATLCYLRSHGQTLMMHRIKRANDMHAGKWNGLGGKLLPGETPEACAIREVCEESGLTMINPVLRGILTFPGFANDDDWYTFVFMAQAFTGTLIECDEGVLRWIDDSQLLDLNLWEGDRIFLPWLDRDEFFSGRFTYVNNVLADHEVVFYRGQQIVTETAAPLATTRPESTTANAAPVSPTGYRPVDDTYCWVCHGPVTKRHCKIACTRCGFTRDCSDP